MEFVEFAESWEALAPLKVVEISSDDDLFRPGIDEGDGVVFIDLLGQTPGVETDHVDVPRERAADALEVVVHKMHLAPLLLFPMARWRNVFETVAFELAENESWQEVDSTASVKFNTRDPLVCEAGDLHTVHDLLGALLRVGETSEHGITLCALGKPIVVSIEPPSIMRLEIGDAVLASEIVPLLEKLRATP